jgi:threonine dehydratase
MTLIDIFAARKRIAPFVRRTPIIQSAWLSDLTGARVSLKLESLQRSGAFKARGAFNAVIARLERGELTNHSRLVTASAGNHGRGLAAAAETFGLPLVVFTPADAPQTKLSAIRRHGAELRAEGRDYDHAEILAKTYARDTGATFVSAYSDADVIAGAGTVALEMFEEMPDVDTFVVPIGGGGLVSGIATAVKATAPAHTVVGVELDVSHAFQESLRAGRLVEIVAGSSLAEGLGGNPDPDTITFGIIQQHVNRIVTVSEDDLRAAVVGLIEAEHLVTEPSGAAGVAALLGQRLDVHGRRVGVIVTGGNIDRSRLTALLGAPAAAAAIPATGA